MTEWGKAFDIDKLLEENNNMAISALQNTKTSFMKIVSAFVAFVEEEEYDDDWWIDHGGSDDVLQTSRS